MATQLKEPEIEEDTPLVEEEQTERDFEAEARLQGWKPEGEFKDGDKRPAKFKDAETFVREGEEKAGLQTQKLHFLEREVKRLTGMMSKVVKSEQAAYENALAEIKAGMKEAVRTGDEETYDALEVKAERVRKDMKADTPAHGEDPDDEYDSFREGHAWYDKANLASASETEIEARLFADRLADKYARQGLLTSLSPSQFFARIADETEARYPTLTTKAPRKKPPSDVEGVTRTGPAKTARTGANLPAHAKEQVRRFIKQGVYKDMTFAQASDEFAKDFDWSQA